MADTVVSPSQQIVDGNPSNRSSTIKSAGGKSIELRALSVLDQMKVIRAMGAMHSSNYLYREMVESAFMVICVDGKYPARPGNEEQIDKLIGRLGDDVMEAVMAWRTREIFTAMKAAEDAVWGEEDGKPADESADEPGTDGN